MKIYFWIKADGRWQKVSYDEYTAFDGQKEIRIGGDEYEAD